MNEPLAPQVPTTSEPSLAVARRDVALPADNAVASQSPQDLRAMEVSDALAPAYQRASTLELSDEEVAALMAPFPDEFVEVRPHDGLLFIPHIHISNRLNRVFKPGKWALVRRREWFDADASTMYGEYVLVIRGCYVGESVGGHPYVRNNPKINFSDVLESTAAEALRRIAAKRLSCGCQCWDPEYCRRWEETWRGYSAGKYFKKSRPSAEPTPQPKPTPAAPKAAPKYATEATRQWLLSQFKDPALAEEYARAAGILLPNETLAEWPLEFVPISQEQRDTLLKCLEAFGQGFSAAKPYAANPKAPAQAAKPVDAPSAPAATDEPWRTFPMPFGKNAGTTLGDMDKKYLYGLWANYTVETEFNGKPKKPESIARDRQFRAMLDAAGQHYNFTKD